jgi:hypothetical protein
MVGILVGAVAARRRAELADLRLPVRGQVAASRDQAVYGGVVPESLGFLIQVLEPLAVIGLEDELRLAWRLVGVVLDE